MAMQELTEEAAHGIDVVGLVSKEPTWKELIIELVDKNKLNPWEIDIVQIVDNYMDAVRGMKSWSQTDYKERVKIFRKAAELFSTHKFRVAAILSIENGKTRYESIGEVDEAIDFLNYYCTGCGACLPVYVYDT